MMSYLPLSGLFAIQTASVPPPPVIVVVVVVVGLMYPVAVYVCCIWKFLGNFFRRLIVIICA